MNEYKIVIDKDYAIGQVDPLLYSSFMEHVGTVVNGGLYDPGHATADEQGFRKDVIEAVKELDIPAIRYPGGNFVSNFDWKDSIGPRENRPTRLELGYLAIEDNSVGLDEYVDWARKSNTEVMYTLNMGNPNCARDAGFLMDYCNFPGGTAWSDLRIKNGHKSPHNIKYWCLGNEMDGPWQLNAQTAENYGLRACETAKIMKWTDPAAKLVVVGSSNPETKFPQWDRTVLEHCYNHVDYLSIHRYYPLMENPADENPDITRYLGAGIEMGNYIRVIASTIDYVKAKTRSKNSVAISFDEYATTSGPPLGMKYEDSDGAPRTDKAFTKGSPVFEDKIFSTQLDALAFSSILCALINNSDRVKIACQSMLLAGMLRAAKNTPLMKQAIFYPFKHVSLLGRGQAVRCVVKANSCKTKLITWSLDETVEIPLIQTAAVYNEGNGRLNVFVLNADANEAELNLDLRAYGKMELDEHIVMDAPLNACNTLEHPEEVVPRTAEVGTDGEAVHLTGYSWNVLRYKKTS